MAMALRWRVDMRRWMDLNGDVLGIAASHCVLSHATQSSFLRNSEKFAKSQRGRI